MNGSTIAIEDDLDWDRFAERYWDRAPVLFRRIGQPPFQADECLAAAVTACAPDTEDAIPDLARLTSDGRRLLKARGRVPLSTDAGFDSYAKRITEALNGDRHALVISGFHPHDPALWNRERAYFRPLWERVGLPMTTAITTLFHGNYEHSPVGVHKDRFGTFMYVLSGRKRMRMWPGRPWDHDASTIVDYERYLDTSIAAEAEAGQLMYWPASFYHVGETVGTEPATSVNVGVPREGRRVEFEISDLLADVPASVRNMPEDYLNTRMPPIDADPFTDPGDTVTAMPAPLRQGMDRAIALLHDAWEGPRRLAVTLNRYTAGGFRPVPEPAPRPQLDDTTRLRRLPDAEFLWATTDTGAALCSGNGHTAKTITTVEAIAAVTGLLNHDGPDPTLAELLAVAPAAEREPCRELLAELCALRVLDVRD